MGLAHTSAPSTEVQEEILRVLSDKVLDSGEYQGDFWIQISGNTVREVVEVLKKNPAFHFESLVDLCGVDYLGRRNPRFEVVVHLYSMKHHHRIRVRVLVPDETGAIPTLTKFWKGANWHEREAYDQYGILFEGHPNLTRILNAPTMKDFPQRKDYPLKGERQEKDELE